jgi:hypothetical protein
MAEINFQRLSRRPFSACNWMASVTEFRTSLITGDATIDRLEDTREIQMQAALRRRSRSQHLLHGHSLLQAATVAVPQITRNRNDASLGHQHEGIWVCLARGKTGVLGANDRSFGGLFHTQGLM